MSVDFIKIRGARTHNLKNVSLDIPRNQLVVITGLSGSGKSSLAFDTIYAEGQRRYVESLSSYARQFVGLMDKPDTDLIEGLSPAISIDQRTIGHNPRSTVGTITDIYDYLRLLYAKCGNAHCAKCSAKLKIASKKSKQERRVRGKIVKSDKIEKNLFCASCGYERPMFEPREFSFNSGHGACPDCAGLGDKMELDKNLIFNERLSILEGAIKPLSHSNLSSGPLSEELESLAKRCNLDLNKAVKEMSQKEKDYFLKGDDYFNGLIDFLNTKYKSTKSNFIRQEIEKSMHKVLCSTCQGSRLKSESLGVYVDKKNIFEISNLSLLKAKDLFLAWQKNEKMFSGSEVIVAPILKEVIKNLKLMCDVGLSYLTLSRSASTLSGGEAQRIRLASQVGSSLSGVLYVLDEPSIGLHQKDNDKLIETLKELRDNGNTVIVVEHDEATMLAADYLIDIGPGAGENGGEVLFAGKPQDIKKQSNSLTGAYLAGNKKIEALKKRRIKNDKELKVVGASEHNLKNIDVSFPLGSLVSVTGVSGSGKSTLMNDILANYLSQKFYRAKTEPGKFKEIKGVEHINKVINIDQSPIGRTPRSNPATYTGLFTPIRDIFADLPEARVKGLKAGHFSFNVPGGRCEHCSGDGAIKVEMQFLSDVYVTCQECEGKKFKDKVLEVAYKGKSIYEVLEMTVSEAKSFFRDNSAIVQKLSTLEEVGLGYIRLGQSATTFSGGEAQRIKLATELSRRSTGKTLYILDEPTTGLHFDDIYRLLSVLNMLVDQGNTVLVIEHNLEVIKASDWIVDLGPGGGEEGGELVACGSPKQISENKKSVTGKYLKEVLKK